MLKLRSIPTRFYSPLLLCQGEEPFLLPRNRLDGEGRYSVASGDTEPMDSGKAVREQGAAQAPAPLNPPRLSGLCCLAL